jgi:hypothetical protein
MHGYMQQTLVGVVGVTLPCGCEGVATVHVPELTVYVPLTLCGWGVRFEYVEHVALSATDWEIPVQLVPEKIVALPEQLPPAGPLHVQAPQPRESVSAA